MEWVEQLKYHDGSEKMKGVLDIALKMMVRRPEERLYMWEAEMDLCEMLAPDDDRIPKFEKGSLCIQVPRATLELELLDGRHSKYLTEPGLLDHTQTPLHRAVLKEDIIRVIRLWELGWPLSHPDSNGETPLDIMKQSNDSYLRELESNVKMLIDAAKNGNVKIVKDLLNKGLSPLMLNREGRSAIIEAASFDHTNVINYLLETKTKEQLVLKHPIWGWTPLHTVAKAGNVEALGRILEDCPDVNAHGDCRETALLMAAQNGQKDAVRILLDHGARVYEPYLDRVAGDTPVHGAAECGDECGDEDVLQLLLQAKDGHKCLEKTNPWGETPILRAVHAKGVGCFEILQQHGASLHAVKADGWSVLHLIAQEGLHDLLMRHISEFAPEEFDARTNGNQTPLMVAKVMGHKEVAQLLRSHLRQLHRPTLFMQIQEAVREIFGSD